eukprot:CAMPEP_0119385392 /NCGR_PEP_ID=MMETSP1334-20130426/91019_1 /TAXON_ID=127549 /ORGANISM="Calcidiscus leptoporus, Strain RCC1130" /LENGTH=125 /DNA_ID=CAMNT_0007406677 /DNA_START=163 /DNA_END=537 /DNA_ORIENTATION=-
MSADSYHRNVLWYSITVQGACSWVVRGLRGLRTPKRASARFHCVGGVARALEPLALCEGCMHVEPTSGGKLLHLRHAPPHALDARLSHRAKARPVAAQREAENLDGGVLVAVGEARAEHFAARVA